MIEQELGSTRVILQVSSDIDDTSFHQQQHLSSVFLLLTMSSKNIVDRPSGELFDRFDSMLRWDVGEVSISMSHVDFSLGSVDGGFGCSGDCGNERSIDV